MLEEKKDMAEIKSMITKKSKDTSILRDFICVRPESFCNSILSLNASVRFRYDNTLMANAKSVLSVLGHALKAEMKS